MCCLSCVVRCVVCDVLLDVRLTRKNLFSFTVHFFFHMLNSGFEQLLGGFA